MWKNNVFQSQDVVFRVVRDFRGTINPALLPELLFPNHQSDIQTSDSFGEEKAWLPEAITCQWAGLTTGKWFPGGKALPIAVMLSPIILLT